MMKWVWVEGGRSGAGLDLSRNWTRSKFSHSLA
jgi:hypothetical protein